LRYPISDLTGKPDEKQDDEKQEKQDKVPLIPLSAGLPTHPEQTRPEQELGN
jgi:hypothetical protein